MAPLSVLFHDRHVFAINKPCGIPSIPAPNSPPSAFERAKNEVLAYYPKHTFFGAIHRLDSVASGAILFAKTEKAAKRLSLVFRREDDEEDVSNELVKTYLAVTKIAPKDGGRMIHFLDMKKDTSKAAKVIVRPFTPSTNEDSSNCRRGVFTRKAILDWRVLAQNSQHSLVEIDLITGRRHQIRAQFGFEGMPIVGDTLYSDQQGMEHLAFSSRRSIALHAASLTFPHPVGGAPMTITAPIPDLWARVFGSDLSSVATRSLHKGRGDDQQEHGTEPEKSSAQSSV